MSDITVDTNREDGTALAKIPFRVPFLSGRMPQARAIAATKTITPLADTPRDGAGETVSSEETVSNYVATPQGEERAETEAAPTSFENTPDTVPGGPKDAVSQGTIHPEMLAGTLSKKESVTSIEGRISFGLSMLEILTNLRKKQDDFFQLKEQGHSGKTLELIQKREAISLSFMSPQEKMSFCLTFLTAAFSRSSSTLIEASFMATSDTINPEVFINKLISFKKSAWEEVGEGGLPDETSAILALAPLLTLISLEEIFSRKNGTRTLAENTAGEEALKIQASAENLVQVGEDIWTVTRDQLKKLLPEVTAEEIQNKDSHFNAVIKTAVDEIQKNSRDYGIEGGVRMLIAGNTIDRKAIYDLLLDIQNRVDVVTNPQVAKYTIEKTGDELVANQLNALQAITGQTGIAAPVLQVEVKPQEITPSAVNDVDSDTVRSMFLDDAFVKIVKLICKVNDTANLEDCFTRHASLTMKDFMVTLGNETPLIQTEVTTFINWAKNSYLKEKLSAFDGMTLVLVLTIVERGVGGALSSANSGKIA